MPNGSKTLINITYTISATIAVFLIFDIKTEHISLRDLFLAFILTTCFSALCKSIENK